MPIQIIRQDITKLECDAIVNAANRTLLGGGGVDGAIHKAAGRGLLRECVKLGGCKTGEAKITDAYRLPCRYIIHTVGPVWKGGKHGEKSLLESCYRESLRLAKEKECESVAFPLISSGIYGYPQEQALRVAMDVISEFLMENDMLVYIVIFDKKSYQISEKLFADIKSYIDDRYVDLQEEYRRRVSELSYFDLTSVGSMPSDDREEKTDKLLMPSTFAQPPKDAASLGNEAKEETEQAAPALPRKSVRRMSKKASLAVSPEREFLSNQRDFSAFERRLSLEDLVNQVDESFSQMLLRMIDEKGMTDVQCYKKANVDRKLFSKIRSDIHYHPKKTTVLAFAVALELSLTETKDMLMKAGFALSRSSKFDIIIEYFIAQKNYNIMEINEALFAFDQSLLGA